MIPCRLRREKKDKGSVTVEAAIILPLMAALFLALMLLIRISAAESALQSAASDAVKQMAAGMYPVYVLYSHWNESGQGQGWTDMIDKVRQAREMLRTGETWTEHYAAYLPEPLARLLEVFFQGAARLDKGAPTQVDKGLNALMTQMIRELYIPEYKGHLHPERVTVTRVILPSFSDKTEAFVGLELQYIFPVRLPFFEKDLILKKMALERVWIGI